MCKLYRKGREVESGEKSSRPESLDPPDPFIYTIVVLFKFAKNKTIERKTFTKLYVIGTYSLTADVPGGICRQEGIDGLLFLMAIFFEIKSFESRQIQCGLIAAGIENES
jgi:hypothetical protein